MHIYIYIYIRSRSSLKNILLGTVKKHIISRRVILKVEDRLQFGLQILHIQDLILVGASFYMLDSCQYQILERSGEVIF